MRCVHTICIPADNVKEFIKELLPAGKKGKGTRCKEDDNAVRIVTAALVCPDFLTERKINVVAQRLGMRWEWMNDAVEQRGKVQMRREAAKSPKRCSPFLSILVCMQRTCNGRRWTARQAGASYLMKMPR